MADKAHLRRLKQGVKAWNQWRKAHPEIRPKFTSAKLAMAILSGVDLALADLHNADLSFAILDGADLHGADLSYVGLQEAMLQEVDLHKANLSGANLHEANLSNANLREADLRGADLRSADLSRADLSGVHVGDTAFVDINLSTVQGLETVVHEGPSSIDIDTLYRSQGQLPEVFLRGAGVPESFMTYMKSLVGRPFEYYSCFISYSSHDETLAQRLHADLQDKGVRCWFAPEDLKTGDEFRSVIDASIQRHDRLLLILSEYSVQSRWVQKEVETAFEKEGKEHRIVLFPVRIDEAVMQSNVGWAADIRRQRHIGDFRRWKDHDAYQQAFNRLLHDLKADI